MPPVVGLAGRWPTCMPAACRDAADCASGECGLARRPVDCGTGYAAACRNPKDACRDDDDCQSGDYCRAATGDDERWTCQHWNLCD